MSSVRLSHRKTLKKKNLIVTIASNQSPPYETNLLQRYGNMNQAVVSTGSLPPSTTTQITTPTTNDSKFEYIDALPDNTVHQFKAILVHYIRKRLPKGYRQLGKQTVSIPATESQFYAVFKNYIHYYYSATKGIYKCIFRGGSSNQILANILEMEGWETKFYDQLQCTYVVLCDDDNNIEDGDENPITAALTYETIKKLRKPKCVRGQLVVEWKKQKNTDFNGNFTHAGHIYFHFYNSQAMIE
ncbi:hypothetical protein GLOIN_2v1818618 [Rhizophagus irregularis DAOM 181602=DAOM 197198]|uniref:Uncharacterized protein n=1 Tax=Rhizophagus irregularis (strain DAOM 181602 / DAOM 197198 / MUCL 43194) TaxID=747089 RepID=A0A2P4P252_RHIID|nr:hypothetical protein GLOIN_2v1818618 [Rhizophagus irregularis DAOM 181602=DAOM 197198]POG59466.1 hypothetical protein GLOIN_2v1818618 [Rhizophagus irregularis DAOM 181602=DAOM 197198]|eukprot:XP_025166332.1 hypothetical protein GLOIN_2v1818618 [Rhizophagus irregularis DAOM 181602=DAOM 197198]